MAYTNAGLNAAVAGITAAGNYISFHTSDPGTTGAGEIAAGSGGYARQQSTYPAPTAGSSTGSQVTASIPGSTTVSFWGQWSAATGGTFLYGGALSSPESFGSPGQLQHTPTITVTN